MTDPLSLKLYPPHSLVVRRSFGRFMQSLDSLPVDLATALWQRPEMLVAAGRQLRRNGARQTVLLDWASEQYVLKHYVEPTWRHASKQLIVRSRAMRTWRTAHRLADAGIATPRPVACAENRWGPLRRDSFLLYPFVEGRTLWSYLSGPNATEVAAEGEVWKQLELLWQRLADLRASLGDANTGNFIVAPTGRLWVIDVDKAQFHHLAFTARRIQTLRWNQVSNGFHRARRRRELAASAKQVA